MHITGKKHIHWQEAADTKEAVLTDAGMLWEWQKKHKSSEKEAPSAYCFPPVPSTDKA